MSARTPVISIVTPSFNQRAFLEAAMCSVLGDGSEPVEYVVVDGGSTDGSVEVIRDRADRLAWWCSEPDGGQYEAINKGFRHTTGEVMGWLNSSDLYLPWTIATVRRVFAEFPEVDWICAMTKCCVEEDGTFRDMRESPGFSRNAFLSGIHGSGTNFDFIQQETCFWRRSLWEKAGGAIKGDYRHAGDFHLWSEFFDHACLTGLALPLAAFRYHGEQRSAQETYLREVAEILRKAGDAADPPPHHRRVQRVMLTRDADEGADEGRTAWKFRLFTEETDERIFPDYEMLGALEEKDRVIRELAVACDERLALIEKLRARATFDYQARKWLRDLAKKLSFGMIR
jgi:glycosyltransferase involved in cell wall biosynthesis